MAAFLFCEVNCIEMIGKQMSEETKVLETLVGEHRVRVVKVDGVDHTITIKQIKTGKIPKLLRALGPLLSVLSNKDESLDINKIFMFHSEDCLNMLAILIDRPVEFVNELEVSDAVLLIGDALEVNLDFFVQRVLPLLSKGVKTMIQEMQQRKAKIQKSDGQKQPSTSSQQDTESQIFGSMNMENSSSTSE